MTDNLMLRLRKYRPRADRDTAEDYLTEAFCWLLSTHDHLGREFLGWFFRDRLTAIPEGIELSWNTQYPLGGGWLDMLCQAGTDCFVFEHKIDAREGEDQLERYRQYANDKWRRSNIHLALITGSPGQFSDKADVERTWKEVYRWLASPEVMRSVDEVTVEAIDDLLELLAYEGLAPAKPLDLIGVAHFVEASGVEASLGGIFSELGKESWGLPSDYSRTVVDKARRERRVGIEFSRGKHDAWLPGLFIGCVLDGEDHKISHRLDRLKLQLIVSIDGSMHSEHSQRSHDPLYRRLEAYQALCREMERGAKDSSWTFYNHLDDPVPGRPNPWHPLYLERPLMDVLGGAVVPEAQKANLHQAVEEALGLVQTNGALDTLIAALDRS